MGVVSRRLEFFPVLLCCLSNRIAYPWPLIFLEKLLYCDTHCSGIVNLNCRGSLFPRHFSQGGEDRSSCLYVNKEGAIFSFIRWRHDVAHDFAHNLYDAFDGGYKIFWIFVVRWTLVRLLAWETERYDALECMANCISLYLYWISAFGSAAKYFMSLATCFSVFFLALNCSEKMSLRAGRIVLLIAMEWYNKVTQTCWMRLVSLSDRYSAASKGSAYWIFYPYWIGAPFRMCWNLCKALRT